MREDRLAPIFFTMLLLLLLLLLLIPQVSFGWTFSSICDEVVDVMAIRRCCCCCDTSVSILAVMGVSDMDVAECCCCCELKSALLLNSASNSNDDQSTRDLALEVAGVANLNDGVLLLPCALAAVAPLAAVATARDRDGCIGGRGMLLLGRFFFVLLIFCSNSSHRSNPIVVFSLGCDDGRGGLPPWTFTVELFGRKYCCC